MFFHSWEVIGAIQIAFYAILIIVSIYPALKLITNASPFRLFYIRYSILLFAKFVAGAILVAYVHDYTNVNLAIATSVLNAISLGFITMLLAFSIKFVDTYRNPDKKKKKKSNNGGFFIFALLRADYRTSEAWESLLEKVTLVGVIINAVGYSYITSNRSLSKSLQEAGSIIYLATLILISGLIAHKIIKERKQSTKEYKFILIVLAICAALVPFILVRVIYTICGAFTFRVDGTYTTDVSKFTFLFGDWKYYAFIGFLEECICAALYCLMTWVVLTGESNLKRHLESGDESVKTLDV